MRTLRARISGAFGTGATMTLVILVLLVVVLPVGAGADTILVGALLFETFIPEDEELGVPGTTAFFLFNLTGPEGFPPDFPVTTSLVFTDSILRLTLTDGTALPDILLGDVEPGFLDPGTLIDPDTMQALLQFPDTMLFASATFLATLSPTTLTLDDGTTVVTSSSIVTLLLPLDGALVPGDLALIQVTPLTEPVPAPPTLLLLAAATVAAMVSSRCRRGRSGVRKPRLGARRG